MTITENKSSSYITNDDTPIPLPHYTVRAGKLFFMEYKEKPLEPLLIEEFSKITGQYTVGILWEKYNITIDTIIELEKKRLIVIKKNKKENSNFYAKIGILSPHFDDAIFSLGGIVSKYINNIDWYIIDVFSKQDYTLYYQFYERHKNKNFAMLEETIALTLMGLDSFDCWDMEEALLRSKYKGFDFMQEYVQPEDILQVEADCYEQLCGRMQSSQSLKQCEIILCPLCIGHHVDHVLVRQACIQLFFGKKIIIFFEDLPYALSFGAQPIIKWLNSFLKVRLVKKSVDITEYALQKRYLTGIYQSQVRVSQVKEIVRYGLRDNRYFENVWIPDIYEDIPFWGYDV